MKNVHPVFFTGRKDVGKSTLTLKIAGEPPAENSEKTSLNIISWDSSLLYDYSDAKLKIPENALWVYCVDLSQTRSEAIAQEEIEHLKEIISKKGKPSKPILLVGTKYDKYAQSEEQSEEDPGLLTDIIHKAKDSNLIFENKVYYTSCLSGKGIGIERLQAALKSAFQSVLPLSKTHEITKAPAEKKTPSLAFTVAGILIVTLVAIATGFGIGLCMGLWAGPGAFISSILGGKTAMDLVLASSGVGLISPLFFKPLSKTNETPLVEKSFKLPLEG